MQVEQACADAGVPLIWRSFLLGPVFAAQGMTDSPFNLYPIKGAYMWRDMERLCASEGLPFAKPSTFPRGSLLAARVACAHDQAPWVGAFIRAIYSANFGANRPIDASDTVSAVLNEIGQDPEPILAASLTPQSKAKLKQQTETAAKRGVFGAPTMTVGDELFWGQDRLGAAIDWAKAAG